MSYVPRAKVVRTFTLGTVYRYEILFSGVTCGWVRKIGRKAVCDKDLINFFKSNFCIIGGSLGYMISTQFHAQKHFGNIVLGL